MNEKMRAVLNTKKIDDVIAFVFGQGEGFPKRYN